MTTAMAPGRQMSDPSHLPRRIIVIGTTGSGKTTTARAIARCLGLAHVELDGLHHERGWTEATPEVFRERLLQATAGGGWVVDGNYQTARELIWPQAELAVWLDYPLGRVLLQLSRRTARRLLTREELWNGNRERWRDHFLSRQSLFLWVLQTHARRRRDFERAFQTQQYGQMGLVRLRSPRAAERWLAALCAKATGETPAHGLER